MAGRAASEYERSAVGMMRSSVKNLLLVVFALSVLVLTGAGEVIRLKNGVELHGEVLAFDAMVGVVVKRCDNDGIITLRWEHIHDTDAEEIKSANGYGDMEVETILIRATRLLLDNGDFVIGVRAESSRDGVLTLHRMGKDYDYLHNRINGVETVEVAAQEIFTAQELYAQKISGALPETVLDHFKVGVFCESIAFYARALEHFQIAAEIDPSFKPKATAHKIEQMEIKRTEKEATQLLGEIRNRLYKKKFSRALEMCDIFLRTFPLSRQKGDLEKLHAKVMIKRQSHYQQLILTDYFTIIDRVAARIAKQSGLKLGDALAYARDEMCFDIKENLARLYGMEIEEIEELWKNRKGGGLRSATYGTATFILGEEAHLLPAETTEPERKEEKKEALTVDERLREKIEAIKKARDKNAARRVSVGQPPDAIGQSPEQWWRNSKVEWKKQLVCAYYAEWSGDVKIHRIRLRKCASCEGKGWFLYFPRGEEIKTSDPCPVCKTLGIVRVVYYK